MVQQFRVLCCYKCSTFQVHQIGKTTEQFACKVCNEKQSIKRVFCEGAAKDCRVACQQLNMKKQLGESDQVAVGEDYSDDSEKEVEIEKEKLAVPNKQPSKWESFINKPIDHDEIEDKTIGMRDSFAKPRKRTNKENRKRKYEPFKKNQNTFHETKKTPQNNFSSQPSKALTDFTTNMSHKIDLDPLTRTSNNVRPSHSRPAESSSTSSKWEQFI